MAKLNLEKMPKKPGKGKPAPPPGGKGKGKPPFMGGGKKGGKC
jgi:hypothetical protein